MTQPILEDLFAAAEGATVFIASAMSNNLTGFISSIVRIPVMRRAMAAIGGDPALADAVVCRLRRLLSERYNVDELHPEDAAIAVYLFVLAETNSDAFGQAMKAMGDAGVPNLFWANAMYDRYRARLFGSDTVSAPSGDAPWTDETARSEFVSSDAPSTTSASQYTVFVQR